MKQYERFIFDSCDFDRETGEVRLRYSLDDEISFTETLEIPVSSDLRETSEATLFALHLAGGVSYYKTCCPKRIEIRSGSLNAEQADFWNSVYENGLGEFFYQNKINFHGLIKFPGSTAHRSPLTALPHGHTGKTLIPIGGGKDSAVTIEKLRAIEGKHLTLIRMGAHPLIENLVSVTGLPCIYVQRKLPRKLFEMNEQGALNGHVPITAFLSCLCVFIAELMGFDEIAMSNEKSANIGNVEYLGKQINHQWSKSEEFETMFDAYVRKHIDPDLRYFSALREMTELEIAGEFIKHPQYFMCTTSCNRNWKILNKGDGGATHRSEATGAWCGTCPKCAFVFALMAAYLKKDVVLKIFGKNIFENAETIPLYKQLLGMEGFKPFECVGTPEETKEAFEMIKKRGEFDDTPVMQMFLQS